LAQLHAQDKPKKKKPTATAIRIVVSLGLLGFLFYKMGPDKILGAIRGAVPLWVLCIFALMVAEHVHATYKWLILLRHTDHDVRFWPLFKITYISGFVGMFLPGAVGIELVRMYGLAKQTSDLAMSFTSILMDRILGLTGLSAFLVMAGTTAADIVYMLLDPRLRRPAGPAPGAAP